MHTTPAARRAPPAAAHARRVRARRPAPQICVLDPRKPSEPELKRQRRAPPGAPEVFAPGANYRLLRSRDVLLHFGALPGGELLAVRGGGSWFV